MSDLSEKDARREENSIQMNVCESEERRREQSGLGGLETISTIPSYTITGQAGT